MRYDTSGLVACSAVKVHTAHTRTTCTKSNNKRINIGVLVVGWCEQKCRRRTCCMCLQRKVCMHLLPSHYS